MTVLERKKLGLKRAGKRYYILAQLEEAGYTPAMLAQELGISYVAMWKFLAGQSHSQRIMDKMREKGVAEKHLFDPKRKEDAAA